MNLIIDKQYNELFGDPCRGTAKWLIITYINHLGETYINIFKENEKVYILDIKEIISIKYGVKCKWIEVKDKCKLTENMIHKYDYNGVDINKIKDLYNGPYWGKYHLADCIRFRGTGRNKIKNITYKGTIANKYNQTARKPFDLHLLYNIFNSINYFKNPDKNIIVMHCRIGDIMDPKIKHMCNSAWQAMSNRSIYNILQEDKYKHLKEIHILFGAHMNIKAYTNSINYLKDVKNTFKNHKLKFIMSKNPDFDFYYMCHSKYFIQGGGGYSNVIASYVTALNNTVINNNMMPMSGDQYGCGSNNKTLSSEDEKKKKEQWDNYILNFRKTYNIK